MRDITESEFESIMEEHELWLKSDGQAGKQASFRGCRLAFPIEGRRFSKVDFSESDLREASFRNCYADCSAFCHTILPAEAPAACYIASDCTFLGTDCPEVTLEEWNEAYAAHQKWIESGGKEGQQARFPGRKISFIFSEDPAHPYDLSGIDFGGCDLYGSDLSNTICDGNCFDNARMPKIPWENTEMTDTCTFDGTACRPVGDIELARRIREHVLWQATEGKEGKKACFTGEKLPKRFGWKRKVALTGIDFRWADARYTEWENVVVAGSLFSHARLNHFHARHTIFQGFNSFQYADLSDGIIEGEGNTVVLRSNDFRHARAMNLTVQNASTIENHWNDANMTGAHMNNVFSVLDTYQGTILNQATMDARSRAMQSDYSGAYLIGIDSRAWHTSCIFDGATIANGTLNRAHIIGKGLKGAIVDQTNLELTHFESEDLKPGPIARQSIHIHLPFIHIDRNFCCILDGAPRVMAEDVFGKGICPTFRMAKALLRGDEEIRKKYLLPTRRLMIDAIDKLAKRHREYQKNPPREAKPDR